MPTTCSKVLFVYDFDHTLVEENSDIVVEDLLKDKARLRELRRDVYQTRGWTAYMDAVFSQLAQQGVSRQRITRSIMDGLHLTAGFGPLIQQLAVKSSIDCDQIIVSDANSQFIELFLQDKNLRKHFAAIYTNPATWNSSDQLSVQPFNATPQTECRLCPSNLCKGSVLQTHLKSYPESTRVIYVGDGEGDLCPCTRLRPGSLDLACVRRGYDLEKLLMKKKSSADLIKADIVFWTNGFELTELLAARGVKINIKK